ncbi:MAG: 2TM domain-containing protein [Promethearchaeota archaeon]|jgi:hypothetical protein
MNGNSGFSEESLRNIAAQKVSFRFSVKIHSGIFIIVNILLFVVNFFFTPDLYWIIFPFFSWLIGLNVHILSYILYARGVSPMSKRGIIYHIDIYLFVMLYLSIINLTTYSEFYWVIFPAIFWGVGVIITLMVYYLFYYKKVEESGKVGSRKERAIERELEKMRKKQNQ